ncbi:MAG: ATP-binding cassette domain-containing protein [Anaerolineales bacterium]
MNKNIKQGGFKAAVVLLVAGLLLSACAPATPVTVVVTPTPEPAGEKTSIKIGFIADISGVGYIFSQSQLAGLKIALDELNDRADHILESVGLLGRRNQLSGTLSLGDQKRLEIGLALALEPRLMLLDEPTAGMSPEETWSTVSLIERLAHEFRMTVLFTEHDMAVVFRISQTIRVLYYGSIIASGTPQAISEDPEVQRVYLGEKEARSRFRG